MTNKHANSEQRNYYINNNLQLNKKLQFALLNMFCKTQNII